MAAAIIGSLLLIGASTVTLSFLGAPAVALLGIAWLGAARLAPSRRLAILTGVLGIAALLEAVDSAIVLLPLPLGVVWIRVLLELAWIGWMAKLMLRSRRRGVPAPVRIASTRVETGEHFVAGVSTNPKS